MPLSTLHRFTLASRTTGEPARSVCLTVHASDTLWGLAASQHLSVAALESHNTIPNPNFLLPGEVLYLTGSHHRALRAPLRLAVASRPASPIRSVAAAPEASERASSSAAQPTAVPQPVWTPPSYSSPPASFTDCVIARESGGNPQVMNSSGHYGLFQFSYALWVSSGGPPSEFGDAPASVQYAVFDAAYAANGTQPWQPWDGCS